MTDDTNDQAPEHSDDFEEEFDFDEIAIEEDVLAAEPETQAQSEREPTPERKSSALPLLIGLTVVGFIGWKVYGMFAGPKKPEAVASQETTAEKESQKAPEMVAQGKELPVTDLPIMETKAAAQKPTQDKAATTAKSTDAKPQTLPASSTLLSGTPAAPAEKPTAPSAHATATVTTNAPAAPTSVLPSAPPPATASVSAAPVTHMQAAPIQSASAPQPTTLVVTTPPMSAPTTTTLSVSAEPIAQTAPATNEETKNAFAKLERELNEQEQFHKEHFAALEKNLTMTAQNSANTNKSVAALEQEVVALTNVIQDLTRELKMVREEQSKLRSSQQVTKATAPKMKVAVRTDANPSLSIHAIIPGRAWLRAQDGKMLTVAEGDAIGEYGKVLKIDAANGIVVTTSGVTLR